MSFIPEKNKEFLWWRDGVIYQIYPRSFCDSNGDGIGDLKGITSKLDYLEDLGVSAIWLSPVYPSPDVDFGYDVADYRDINPIFGDLSDFSALTDEAHRRGIRVIMDLVMNHTSDQHPWFKEARKSKDNPYHDYYLWRDPLPNQGVPNDWQSHFGGSAWEYVEECGQYYFHMFTKEQPDVNWRNPKVYQYMMDNFRFWAERGVDGFRLDVFNAYFKDDQYRQNPKKFGWRAFDRQRHIYDCNRPEMDETVKDIRKVINEFPERYVVGETFLSESDDDKAADYCGEDKLQAAFNFKFSRCAWNVAKIRKEITRWVDDTGDKVWPNYVLNNHDLPRSATRFGLGDSDRRLKAAAALTILLRGTPFIYYGEEIGMRDISVKRSEILDPVGKRYWPFNKGRDGCRAPMQWNNQRNAGFSTGKPWLPVNQDYEKRNVNAMIHDPDSLFSFYREVIALRLRSKAFRVGDQVFVDEKNESILAFSRKSGAEIALVCLNFSQLPAKLRVSEELAKASWKTKLSDDKNRVPEIRNGELQLMGEQVLIMVGKIAA